MDQAFGLVMLVGLFYVMHTWIRGLAAVFDVICFFNHLGVLWHWMELNLEKFQGYIKMSLVSNQFLIWVTFLGVEAFLSGKAVQVTFGIHALRRIISLQWWFICTSQQCSCGLEALGYYWIFEFPFACEFFWFWMLVAQNVSLFLVNGHI